MWLIDIQTYALCFFGGDEVPPYAILSHMWKDDEVGFQDFRDLQRARHKKGFQKIQWTCEEAGRKGLHFAWVDTCCIDKSSSAELQEAINSMFRWYEKAEVCYAYLADVHQSSSAQQGDLDFEASKWFTRGWTLQELIAPPTLSFFDSQWNFIGTRMSLLLQISRRTWIPVDLLRRKSKHERLACSFDLTTELSHYSVAQRLSWAAARETSRIEDRAYSLLGLFGVFMPLLYGEGKRAFRRLQEEIFRGIHDFSILAWHGEKCSLLADDPSVFARSRDIVNDLMPEDYMEVAPVNVGLRLTRRIHCKELEQGKDVTQFGLPYEVDVYLSCHDTKDNTRTLVLHTWAYRGINTGEAMILSPGWLFVDLTRRTPCQLDRLGALDVLHASTASDPTSLLIRFSDTAYDGKQLLQLLQSPQTFWLRFNSAGPGLRDQHKPAATHYVVLQDFPSNSWKQDSLSFSLTPPTLPMHLVHNPTQTTAVLLARTDTQVDTPHVMLAIAWDWTGEDCPVDNVRLHAQPIDRESNQDRNELAGEVMRTAVQRRRVDTEKFQVAPSTSWNVKLKEYGYGRERFVTADIVFSETVSSKGDASSPAWIAASETDRDRRCCIIL